MPLYQRKNTPADYQKKSPSEFLLHANAARVLPTSVLPLADQIMFSTIDSTKKITPMIMVPLTRPPSMERPLFLPQ